MEPLLTPNSTFHLLSIEEFDTLPESLLQQKVYTARSNYRTIISATGYDCDMTTITPIRDYNYIPYFHNLTEEDMTYLALRDIKYFGTFYSGAIVLDRYTIRYKDFGTLIPLSDKFGINSRMKK